MGAQEREQVKKEAVTGVQATKRSSEIRTEGAHRFGHQRERTQKQFWLVTRSGAEAVVLVLGSSCKYRLPLAERLHRDHNKSLSPITPKWDHLVAGKQAQGSPLILQYASAKICPSFPQILESLFRHTLPRFETVLENVSPNWDMRNAAIELQKLADTLPEKTRGDIFRLMVTCVLHPHRSEWLPQAPKLQCHPIF
ncbi:LOW QUALITY PROTEIN: uteroglobin [Microcebus murinus]|uniref:LOW QUALITY PROTEIN: uteroglobin n=1 Tax=Microcebus murinus TaxID=30608 RepID=UPI003F6C3A41